MSSVLRRVGSKLERALARSADPTTESGRALTYSKLVNSVAEFFSRSGNGIVQRLTGPNAILPTGYIDSIPLTWLSVTQVVVGLGRTRSDDDTLDINIGGLITTDITLSGVRGLDTGVEAANTWYSVWVIADSTGANAPATLLSASFTAPVLPAGYDKKRRIGCVRNDASLNLINFFQKWKGSIRRYWFNTTAMTALTNGAATVFTAVPLSSFMPPTSRNVILEWRHAPGVAGALGDALTLRPTGATSTTGPFVLRRGSVLSNTMIRFPMEMPTSDSQSIDYKVTAATDTATLIVNGFDDVL